MMSKQQNEDSMMSKQQNVVKSVKKSKKKTDSPMVATVVVGPPSPPPVTQADPTDSVVMFPDSDAARACLAFQELCEQFIEPKLYAEREREREEEEREREEVVVDEGFNDTPSPLGCPRCEVELEYGEVEKEDGELFCYWRCPKEQNGVKCFVTHQADDQCGEYLELVKAQLADCYWPSGDSVKDCKRKVIPFINMECYCCSPLVLITSQSEKNPNRLFFKCKKGECKFFQWADSVPRGKVWHWLRERVGPEAFLAQHKPPPNLQKPSRKRPAEVTPRSTYQSKKSKVGVQSTA